MGKTHIWTAIACFFLPVGFVLLGGSEVFESEPRSGLGTLYYFYKPC